MNYNKYKTTIQNYYIFKKIENNNFKNINYLNIKESQIIMTDREHELVEPLRQKTEEEF